MNIQTHTHAQQEYKGGSLNRIQAQWVADWLREEGKTLPSGWTSIWRMNSKKVASKYNVKIEDVILAGNGEKR